MARKYPRFLYSNPLNTKSPGPFLIHTLFPRVIFKVHIQENSLPRGEGVSITYSLQHIDDLKIDEDNVVEYETAYDEGLKWLTAQIRSGAIVLPAQVE
jgi:hypothetical protein